MRVLDESAASTVMPAQPHLVWVYTGSLLESLDAATWLDTTAELRRLGWRVTLVTAGLPGRQHIRGIEVFGIPMGRSFGMRQFAFHLRLAGLLLAQGPAIDIVLFHSMSALWLLPLRLARMLARRRRPLFVMDTRTVNMAPKDRYRWRDNLRCYYLDMMEYLANYWADGRLAITARMVQTIGIPAARLWGIWPSGVAPERFAAAAQARVWPAAGEPIQLIYTGALHHERNLPALCRAVQQANARGMSFRLTLIGSGSAEAELQHIAATGDGSVCVSPPVPHEAVAGCLAAAHVGVLPFPDEEKFRVSSPIKLFEYMAAGMPIIATPICAHREVVGDGACVVWTAGSDMAELYSGLCQLWQQRADLEKMGAAAAAAVVACTWQESARKLHDALTCGLGRNQEVQ